MRILVVSLDSDLKWESEFKQKLAKDKSLCCALRHLSYSHPTQDIALLMKAVFLPTLLYSCTTWCNVGVGRTKQLQVLCNRVSKLSCVDVNIEKMMKERILNLLEKALDPSHPLHYMTEHCISSNSRPARRPRLTSVRTKNSKYYESFLPCAVRLYNAQE